MSEARHLSANQSGSTHNQRQSNDQSTEARVRTALAAASWTMLAGMLVLLAVALVQKQKGGNSDPAFAGAVLASLGCAGLAFLNDRVDKRINAKQ